MTIRRFRFGRVLFLLMPLSMLMASCSAFRSSPRPGSEVAPPAPADCPAGTGNTLVFTWNAPVVAGGTAIDTSVQGYNFYYGRESGRYNIVEGASNTTHMVRPLGVGTYYFAVTAYNAVGESGYSNEVVWTGTSCPSLQRGKVQFISMGKNPFKKSRPDNIGFDGNSFSDETTSRTTGVQK